MTFVREHSFKWAGFLAGSGLILSAAIAFRGVGGHLLGQSDLPNLKIASPRVVVLKRKRTLHLFDGTRLVRSYPIDLGFAPDGEKLRKDDGRTPVGEFRVVSKNAQSAYHRFIGLSYPGEKAVARGLASGLISAGEAASVRQALTDGRRPNWNTGLGGGIGIHGHRIGQDWTGGCVALSDTHMDELFDVLRIGDPVEILP